MAECKDTTSRSQINSTLLSTVSFDSLNTNETRVNTYASNVSQNGNYTLGIVEQFTEEYRDSVVSTINTGSPLTTAISTYGSEAVTDSLAAVNAVIQEYIETITTSPLYESLSDRVTGATIDADTTGTTTTTPTATSYIPITPVEYSVFLEDFPHTPSTIQTLAEENPTDLLEQLETFYEEEFTSSAAESFCSIVTSAVFAAVAFFTTIGEIQNQIQDAIEFLENFSLEDLIDKAIDEMKALIDQLKKQVIDKIVSVIEKVKSAIENFSLEAIVGEIEKFVNEQILYRIEKLREDILFFFSEENIERIKKKIEDSINYAVNLFKDADIEEITYLVYRFCTLIAEIEKAINSLKNPLDDFAKSYVDAYNRLKTVSNINTANAVAAGAIRPSEEKSKAGYDRAKVREIDLGNFAPVDASELLDATKWNDGKGDSRVTFAGRWVTYAGTEANNYEDRVQELGWTEVDFKARVGLMRIQKEFGKQLTVNSGYRPRPYNEFVEGAKNSYHIGGFALDVTWSGFNSESIDQFISIARKVGFGGIGFYSSFIHIDLGPKRSWGR